MAGLAGRTALVTGGAQGIGLAVARRLSADGARVAVLDVQDGPPPKGVAGGVRVRADVADAVATTAAVAEVEERLGPVELLVAGAATMHLEPFGDHDRAAWWRQVEVNLLGVHHAVDAVLPGMRRAGGGRAVLVASEWGVNGWPNATAYSAAKAGVIALAKSLGRELGPEGVAVNAVAPSVVDTPQLVHDAADAGLDLDAMRERYAAETPLRRIGTAEEIAATIAFLLGPDAGAIVGQVLQPNGGTTRGPA